VSSREGARPAAALARAHSIADLRRIAQRRLPRAVFEFIDGGAEDETTLRDNRAALERIRLVPRVLGDVSDPQTQTTILGQPAHAPLVVAPMGCCMLAWPNADLAIARAAASVGIPYTMSTMAAISIERMADALQGELWFQLYVLKDHAFNDQLVDRAWAAGFRTLVVTVDLQTGGRRERDLRNGLSVPLKPSLRLALDGLTHPHWALQMLTSGMPQFENVRGYLADKGVGLSIAARVGQSLDAAWGWHDLARLRERWKGRLAVKGVLHPADATRMVELGVDAIWVSNHGGRQLDGAVATADALPAIAAAVNGKAAVLLDSGVRRGVDILKARARGAQAVAVGRAALYGAAAGGEEGARLALRMLIDELRVALMLHGTRTIDEVTPAPIA
jgi:isopentenyl diphosphate isomerase/L-lactate dehydrogenase-like FMN-dependent dehydrogenase